MWWNSKRQNENPQSCRSGGFLARYGELFRLGCCYLLSTAQPFAYVIANYICQHGDKKCGEKIIQEIHLLSAGGAAAHYYNTKPEQNVQSVKFNSRILQPGIWNLWLLCWDNVFCGDMPWCSRRACQGEWRIGSCPRVHGHKKQEWCHSTFQPRP